MVEPPHWFPNLWSYYRKFQWKPLELPLPRKIINQYHSSGGIAEISATLKDLKDTRAVIPTVPHSPFYLICAEDRWNLESDCGLL